MKKKKKFNLVQEFQTFVWVELGSMIVELGTIVFEH